MKKLLALSLLLGSMLFTVSSVEAKTASSENAVELNIVQQKNKNWQKNRQYNQNRRYNQRRQAQVITRTRFVRVGGRLYREVYQIRYLPNGRTSTRLLGRTRVR